MGVWSFDAFGNDSAADFMNQLYDRGVAHLLRPIGKGLRAGVARATANISEDNVEELLAERLKEHQRHLDQGLNVGSLEECERIYRHAYLLSAKNRVLWEILEFWCAFAVVLYCVAGVKPPIDTERLERWVKKNGKAVVKKLDVIKAGFTEGLALVRSNIDISARALFPVDQPPAVAATLEWIKERECELLLLP